MDKNMRRKISKVGQKMLSGDKMNKIANTRIRQWNDKRSVSNYLKSRFSSANDVASCNSLLKYIEKQKGITQRSINGTKIENKKFLYETMNELDTYEKKTKSKLSQLQSEKGATESFVNFVSSMII